VAGLEDLRAAKDRATQRMQEGEEEEEEEDEEDAR